jgi:fermentation-respiration switch protein FrsA (DUF1100 family)
MWINILLVFIAIIFIIVLLIKRFVYFRPSYSFLPPKINFQDINIGNLHGWFKKGETKTVVIFCHGNAGNLSYRQDKLIEICKMGHSALIFDYSGFGQSKGIPSEQLCYSNADSFFNFLKESGFSNENIVPYGESLGASVAVYLARKYNLPKVIVESGLPSISCFFKKWRYLSFLKFLFTEFNTISFLKGYKGESLILHSVEDEVVPYDLISELKSEASVFIDMKGGHNNPQIPWDEIEKFLKKIKKT